MADRNVVVGIFTVWQAATRAGVLTHHVHLKSKHQIICKPFLFKFELILN